MLPQLYPTLDDPDLFIVTRVGDNARMVGDVSGEVLVAEHIV